MTMNPTPALLTRRRLVLASTSLTALTLMHPVLANTDELALAVSAYAAGKKVTEGKVKLEIAELVDNGNVVPITVSNSMSSIAGLALSSTRKSTFFDGSYHADKSRRLPMPSFHFCCVPASILCNAPFLAGKIGARAR